MNDTNNREKNPIEELRQKVIKKLEANYAHGYMNLEEFEKQLEMVVHTTLLEDLSRISANLETISSDREAPRNSSINTGDIEPDGTIFCFMGGVKRKGKWSPARNNKVFSLMGGIDLDFSEALLPPGETVFDFFCMMSGINIKVPKGINVEINGLPIMGGIDNKIHYEHNPDNPTIRFRGLIFMGGLEAVSSEAD